MPIGPSRAFRKTMHFVREKREMRPGALRLELLLGWRENPFCSSKRSSRPLGILDGRAVA
jgi:hypothetical protein